MFTSCGRICVRSAPFADEVRRGIHAALCARALGDISLALAYADGAHYTVAAHRVVLAAASPFFAAALAHRHDRDGVAAAAAAAAESLPHVPLLVVHLPPHVTPRAFDAFLEFCYCARVECDTLETVLALVELADEFHIEVRCARLNKSAEYVCVAAK